MLLNGPGVKTERGQYKFTGTNTNAQVTRTITLANPGTSLDRMRLRNPKGMGMYTFDKGGQSYFTGTLDEAYLSAVDTITLKIWDRNQAGASDGAWCWEVERW